jgi:hypothetical protein
MERWPKACGCGEIWTRDQWPELPMVGRYSAGRDGWMELRSCVCGATLGVDVNDVDPKTSERAAS